MDEEYEVQFELTDEDSETVTIVIPNAISSLTAASNEIIIARQHLLDGQIFRVNNNGQNKAPEKIQAYLIHKTKTDLGISQIETP